MPRYDQWSLLALARFLLAAVVAVTHLGEQMQLHALAFIPYFGAFEAILGFLIISGYSVGTSYLKVSRGFLRRRLYRLYPIYLMSIVLTMLVEGTSVTASELFAIVINALFLNQLITFTSFVGPAWSLSLEFWLYTLVPRLSSLSMPNLRRVSYCSFACYAAYTLGRTLFHWPYYAGVGCGLNLALLSFVWICGFRLVKFPIAATTALWDIGFFFSGHILLQATIQLLYRFKHGVAVLFFERDCLEFAAQGFTLLCIWSLMRYLIFSPAPALYQRSRMLRALGDISYPLYLIHIPMFTLLFRAGQSTDWIILSATVIAAGVMYYAFDFYSRARERSAAPAVVTS